MGDHHSLTRIEGPAPPRGALRLSAPSPRGRVRFGTFGKADGMDTFRLNVDAVRRNLPDRGTSQTTEKDAAERLAERVIEVEPIVEEDARLGRPSGA